MSFRRVENLHDASKITLKYSSRYRWRVLYILKRRVHFWTRRIHFGRVVEISYYISMLFSTRRAYFRRVLNYSSIFPRRVENVPDASPKYATIFQCYFEDDFGINDWKPLVNSATRSLNSATRQILHWNIVVYFDEASSQLGKASSQLGDASAQLRDASKMQLWPQWLTIRHWCDCGQMRSYFFRIMDRFHILLRCFSKCTTTR